MIAILVTLALPKFLNYSQKAQETHIIHDVKVLESKMMEYLIYHGNIGPWDYAPDVYGGNILYDIRGKTTSDLIGYKRVPKENFPETNLDGSFYVNDEGRVIYEDSRLISGTAELCSLSTLATPEEYMITDYKLPPGWSRPFGATVFDISSSEGMSFRVEDQAVVRFISDTGVEVCFGSGLKALDIDFRSSTQGKFTLKLPQSLELLLVGNQTINWGNSILPDGFFIFTEFSESAEAIGEELDKVGLNHTIVNYETTTNFWDSFGTYMDNVEFVSSLAEETGISEEDILAILIAQEEGEVPSVDLDDEEMTKLQQALSKVYFTWRGVFTFNHLNEIYIVYDVIAS